MLLQKFKKKKLISIDGVTINKSTQPIFFSKKFSVSKKSVWPFCPIELLVQYQSTFFREQKQFLHVNKVFAFSLLSTSTPFCTLQVTGCYQQQLSGILHQHKTQSHDFVVIVFLLVLETCAVDLLTNFFFLNVEQSTQSRTTRDSSQTRVGLRHRKVAISPNTAPLVHQ